MKCPSNAPIMEFCFSEASKMRTTSKNHRYTSVGPDLVDIAVNKFNLNRYVFPLSFFAPVPWYSIYPDFFTPFKLNHDAYSLHLYNSRWDIDNLPRYGLYPRDSLFENLKQQYGVHTSLSDLFKELWCDVCTYGPTKGSVKVIKKLYHLTKTYLR